MKLLWNLIIILSIISSVNCYASGVSVIIDGQFVESDTQPIVLNNRTLVPMRSIFEELGCSVEWIPETQTVIATKNSKIMALQIGKSRIIMADIETDITEVKEMDVSPFIHDDRTFVPIRVISESFGYAVEWNGEESVITILTKESA